MRCTLSHSVLCYRIPRQQNPVCWATKLVSWPINGAAIPSSRPQMILGYSRRSGLSWLENTNLSWICQADWIELDLKEWVWRLRVWSEFYLIWWPLNYITCKLSILTSFYVSGIVLDMRTTKMNYSNPHQAFPKFSSMLYHTNYIKHTFLITNFFAKANSFL